MFIDKEQNTIGKLYDYLKANPKAILEVEFPSEPVFQAVNDGAYETDNGLDIDEEGYEEYNAILLQRLDNKEYVELSYLHFPLRITCNGVFVAGTVQVEK